MNGSYFVLVIDFDNDHRRVCLDVLPPAVDQHLLEDEQLVPRRRQCLVDHLNKIIQVGKGQMDI